MALWMGLEPEFDEDWRSRASAAAVWLAGASSVADPGCGSMKPQFGTSAFGACLDPRVELRRVRNIGDAIAPYQRIGRRLGLTVTFANVAANIVPDDRVVNLTKK